MKYMLDTNIVSFYLKNKSNKLDKKISMISSDELCISIITQAELYYGLQKINNPPKLYRLIKDFLSKVMVLDWGDYAAFHYGVIRADLEKQGKTIGNMDMLIASHALAENLILITNNTGEFCRIKDLEIQDWTV